MFNSKTTLRPGAVAEIFGIDMEHLDENQQPPNLIKPAIFRKSGESWQIVSPGEVSIKPFNSDNKDKTLPPETILGLNKSVDEIMEQAAQLIVEKQKIELLGKINQASSLLDEIKNNPNSPDRKAKLKEYDQLFEEIKATATKLYSK
ncbi:MAG: hypothetical protein AAB723_03945 [Patescibacteria group bacterium]